MNSENGAGDAVTGLSDRFRWIEYSGDSGPISIIQDTENHRAWVQSDFVVDVRP
ncbi:hypothetical protein [Haloarcula salina]|uniref:Uncharacterized protein n=1 Tax=Haloarcula salina TaxID=1429914 RepID=A0AA41G3C0_9EURY|nr:hypothetical protein [Haloarcula salina]MBV0902791.1 hypothetical protein [Haloarcula salina]